MDYCKLIKRIGGQFTLKKLLPTRCHVCDNYCQGVVCNACCALFVANAQACAICAEPLFGKPQQNTDQQGAEQQGAEQQGLVQQKEIQQEKVPQEAGLICGQCLKNPPFYHKVIASYRYLDPIRTLIIQFKFSGKVNLASFFAKQLATDLKKQCANDGLPDVIIPIPLHRKRLKQRGYNQAQLIAATLAKLLDIPLDNGYLLRVKRNKPQVGLSKSLRIKNIKGFFALADKVDQGKISKGKINKSKTNKGKDGKNSPEYQHILLVDDVITTGATINEASRCLISGLNSGLNSAANPSLKITVCAIARSFYS